MNEVSRRPWPAPRPILGRVPARRVLAGLLPALLAFMPAACGKKTGPQPVSHAAPAPQNVKAYQQGGEILVIWPLPSQEKSAKLGGLTGFILSIDDLRYDCLSCEPLHRRETVLERKAEMLDIEGNRALYAETPAETQRVWRVRVAYRFRDGWSLPSAPLLVRGLIPIPKPAFRAELAERLSTEPGVPGTGAEVSLIWEPVLERKVMVISAGETPRTAGVPAERSGGPRETAAGPAVEKELNYGVNVYRRVQGKSWPRLPLNASPLPGPAWQDRISREAVNGAAGRFEYALRWVSQSGAEGPLSEPIAMNVPVGAR